MVFKISTGQMACKKGQKEYNIQKVEHYISQAGRNGSQILVMPETILTGSIPSEESQKLADIIPGPTTDRFGKLAAQYQLYLVVGMVEKSGEEFYNSSVLFSPEGEILDVYHKWHLFDAEKEWVTPGTQPVIFDTEFGRIALTICYDLVFPEFIRGLVLNGVDLILNSTNWVSDGRQTGLGWDGEVVSRLAATRALENGVHVAMANRYGTIDKQRWSLGHSSICSPSGGFLARLNSGEGLVSAEIDLEDKKWDEWRNIATYLPDRRPEIYLGISKE